ncbi:S41 family peptidase [Deinococcus sp. QL22]|uniref:S41 family peptidase n=1 Tax=Deinococcus sp. QL22 TaxID=2939437 RepID=UPI0020171DF9|nr:S41 family peptidase [Deinococcus sp. QL22]UQN05398.1 S41 family peptidase [Deinococcus sp. QL22]
MRIPWFFTLMLLSLGNFAGAQTDSLTPEQLVKILDNFENTYYQPLDRPALERAASGGLHNIPALLNDGLTRYYPPNDPLLNVDPRISHGIDFGPVTGNTALTNITGVARYSPAWRSGLHPGDLVQAVDGQDVTKLNATQLFSVLAVIPAQHPFQLTVSRKGVTQQVTLQREVVPAVVMRREGLPAGVAYVALPTLFHPDLSDELQRTLVSLVAARVNTVVLDLRDNSGGTLSTVANAADFFMERIDGDIVYLRSRDGGDKLYARASRSSKDFLGRVVILVNRYTASGAEVLASVLQHAGATVVGERTPGMGLVTVPIVIPNGARLLVPSALLVTQAGVIQGQGVTPNIQVVEPERSTDGREIRFEDDPFIQRALQELADQT